MDRNYFRMKTSAVLFLFLANQGSTHALASVAPPPLSPPSSSLSHKVGSLFSGHVKHRALPNQNSAVLTYLEINGWMLSMGGLTILIDPILEGNLDFGIPSLYQGMKRVLPGNGLADHLPPIDCLLITQGLDDHAHVRTLQKLQQLDPNLPIIAPPSAKAALEESGYYNPQILKHQEEAIIRPRGDTASTSSSVRVRATKGALVGPPWQRRENGYILRGSSETPEASSLPSIYIEPHVEFNPQELSRLGPVDVVISPISGQALPAFELVHGPKDTMRLVETLKPKYLVPMQNGDIDTEGPVSQFVSEVGSPSEFERRLSSSNLSTELMNVEPGKDIEISL